jgi:predicted dehydrogenase
MEPLRLGVVGCGAVARIHHLPAIATSSRVTVTALADPALERARDLARAHSVPTVVTHHRALVGAVDAAIVAAPNTAHARIAIDLLEAGIHVLVEKPMALRAADCDEMIAAAERSGAVLAVGLDFRFFSSSRFVRELVAAGWLGAIRAFDLRQGLQSRWPSATPSLIGRGLSGGGVLVDFGVHMLDLLLWWLGDVDSVEYFDDAAGGVEADCELHLKLVSGATGVVELSRSRELRNTCTLSGERGSLEVGVWDPDPPICLDLPTGSRLIGRVPDALAAAVAFRAAFTRQLDDFVDAIAGRRGPFVPGLEGRRAVALIETCYARRRPLREPWTFPDVYAVTTAGGVA